MKIWPLLAAAAAALVFSVSAHAGPVLDRVKASGTVRVCIWPDYYGITWRNPRNEVYKKALVSISENANAVPLWSLPVYYVASKEVVFKPYSDELVRFWEMGWR